MNPPAPVPPVPPTPVPPGPSGVKRADVIKIVEADMSSFVASLNHWTTRQIAARANAVKLDMETKVAALPW